MIDDADDHQSPVTVHAGGKESMPAQLQQSELARCRAGEDEGGQLARGHDRQAGDGDCDSDDDDDDDGDDDDDDDGDGDDDDDDADDGDDVYGW